ncbi:MAG: AI-2E family transporter [Candidatus Uhrbacteria bacterium]
MNSQKHQVTFLLIVLALVAIVSFFVFAPFLQVLAVAMMAAVVTHRFHRRLTSLLGGMNGLAAFLTVLAVAILLLLPFTLLGTQVFTEAAKLYHVISANSDSYFVNFEQSISKPLQALIPGFEFKTNVYAQQALSWLTGNLGKVFSGTVEVIMSVLLFLVAFYYFLKDGKSFAESLMAMSPLADSHDQQVFKRMESAIDSMVRGQLLVAIIQGFLTGIGFTVFGVPNPAVWGCLAALCALVPGLGTSLVNIPAVIFLFAVGRTWPGVGLLIWASLAVGLIDNALGPILIGKGAKIHPLFVLFSVLGGLTFFGPLGFLLGPLVVSLLFALLDLYRVLVMKEPAILTTRLD